VANHVRDGNAPWYSRSFTLSAPTSLSNADLAQEEISLEIKLMLNHPSFPRLNGLIGNEEEDAPGPSFLAADMKR